MQERMQERKQEWINEGKEARKNERKKARMIERKQDGWKKNKARTKQVKWEFFPKFCTSNAVREEKDD